MHTSILATVLVAVLALSAAQDEDTTGLNFDTCKADGDCFKDRKCFKVDLLKVDGREPCASGDKDCRCVLDNGDGPDRNFNVTCKDSKTCLEGDRCIVIKEKDNEDVNATLCMSCNTDFGVLRESFTVESKDGGTGNCPVCIAAAMLTHIPRSDLIWASHKRAQVLCDESGSCATDGHMVVYHGVAMMMSSYCELDGVACKTQSTVVNNPRMSPGLRIASRTTGLEFTAFAARYNTAVEERVLRTLVRVGL